MENTSNCSSKSVKKYSVVLENSNNRVTFAELDKMEPIVALALDLHRYSNISHVIRVMCEEEIIISFYA